MTWFQDLTGFVESSPDEVREQLSVDGPMLVSHANGQSWLYGELETPSLAQLRDRVAGTARVRWPTTVREVVANVESLHQDVTSHGAIFQVASGFNLLEMMDPSFTPEHGVGIYEDDHTQGPACAIAAGAGTIFRNYFAQVDGHVGQSAEHQIDCMDQLGVLLGNRHQSLWQMANGYLLPTPDGLRRINCYLQDQDETGLDQLRQALRIGLQWDTQVTLGNAGHTVSQAYCAACPVAYTRLPLVHWEPLARLVLESSYEAMLCAGILNAARTGNHLVYLTLLGGGSFGNEMLWITDALRRALYLYPSSGLDVAVVSHEESQAEVWELVAEFNGG
jgi:hypothetical protein